MMSGFHAWSIDQTGNWKMETRTQLASSKSAENAGYLRFDLYEMLLSVLPFVLHNTHKKS
jgi:hypothetical protein